MKQLFFFFPAFLFLREHFHRRIRKMLKGNSSRALTKNCENCENVKMLFSFLSVSRKKWKFINEFFMNILSFQQIQWKVFDFSDSLDPVVRFFFLLYNSFFWEQSRKFSFIRFPFFMLARQSSALEFWAGSSVS